MGPHGGIGRGAAGRYVAFEAGPSSMAETSPGFPARRRVLVATRRADLTDATVVANHLERTGREATIAAIVGPRDLDRVDAMVTFGHGDAVLAAAAAGCPLLLLARPDIGSIDLDATLSAPDVGEHPLIHFRLDRRPVRIAFAELIVAMERDGRMRALLSGRPSDSIGRIRISNADPLRLLPRAAVIATGVAAEWTSGCGSAQTVHLGSEDRIALSSSSEAPLVASVDGRSMTAIAQKVQISVGRPLRVLRRRP
jgi:hypothetical protein